MRDSCVLFFVRTRCCCTADTASSDGIGHVIFVHVPVGEDDEIRPLPQRSVRLKEQRLESFLQRSVFIVGDRNDPDLIAFHLHIFQLQHVRIRQNRISHLNRLAVFRHILQKISGGAQIDVESM